MAENIVLSATLELKDKMTAGLTKTKYALSGVAEELKKTSTSADKLKNSLSGIKGDFKTTISTKDNATATIQKVKLGLRDLANKPYTSIISAKDHATAKITQVKTELSGIAGKTYTAILNVKTNMPEGGFNLGNKLNGITGGVMGTSMQMAAGTGIGFGVYDAVKSYMDFEKEMSAVKATSGATEDEFAQLTQKAVQMGADTKFSALESAQAFQFMAQAGWKTGDMLDGISGIMNLAAASGEDLANVSDIVTDALTAFGLKASDSAMFSDVLAQAAASSNTDVGKMGYSFKYAAPLAGQLGYSIQDVATALGLMANAGVKSETAGTSLRALFTRLASPPKDCAEAMDQLGISLTDNTGKIKPFRQLMEEMRASFANLAPAERLAAASALAGQEGMSGLLAIVGASQEDFDNMTNAIDNSAGAAERMAKIRMDNLAGDIEYLSGD